MAGRYRTKVQVLYDVLDAARTPLPKSRLLWQSRLSSASFSRWLRFCRERDLLTVSPSGYCATERAERVRGLLGELLAEGANLDLTVRGLRASLSTRPAPDGVPTIDPEFWRWVWRALESATPDPPAARRVPRPAPLARGRSGVGGFAVASAPYPPAAARVGSGARVLRYVPGPPEDLLEDRVR